MHPILDKLTAPVGEYTAGLYLGLTENTERAPDLAEAAAQFHQNRDSIVGAVRRMDSGYNHGQRIHQAIAGPQRRVRDLYDEAVDRMLSIDERFTAIGTGFASGFTGEQRVPITYLAEILVDHFGQVNRDMTQLYEDFVQSHQAGQIFRQIFEE